MVIFLPAIGLFVFATFSGAVVTEGDDVGSGVGVGVGDGVDVGGGVTTGASWNSLTRTVGFEKVKPLAEKISQPSFSEIDSVATLLSPDSLTIEIEAWTGAFVNP